MSFFLIVVISLVVLGVVAAVSSMGGPDEPIRQPDNGCSSCTSRGDCKLADLVDKGKAVCHMLIVALLLSGCSTKKNTPQTRFWHSFNARYNTYYNGSQAFIDGSLEKESGHKDNCTELIPLYTVGSKQSREVGKGNFDRAIEKAEKVIKLHSIKARPEWNKSRRKTPKDIEWLSRREYNPFLWRAWLLLGKSQFQQGQFEEAAATFSYMQRLYQSQPAIRGIARAWQAKSYVELDWLYDAEDLIVKQRRDSMHYRAVKDWDYTLADYYIRSEQYTEALPYLRKVIKHERRRKQKAREWFLMGQLHRLLDNRQAAYDAFRHVIRLNPPYELEFNARIAQTEVMPATDVKGKIRRLKRMARSDNNKDYLDQVYYAIGNLYLTQNDTVKAIEAYEDGVKKATRSGIEKGVLLLTLGNVYWEREKYADAQRCYGEAIGLLDKDRPDYKQLADRSKVLDELVPYTSAVELQDSLQRLAKMTEEERNKVIDKIIEDLKKKEKEERRAQQEAEAEAALQKQESMGNRQQNARQQQQQPQMPTPANGAWYFYNPQAVSQGKQTFQRQWGKRANEDNWQRVNKTVVASTLFDENGELTDEAVADSTGVPALEGTPEGDVAVADTAAADTSALDPHNREYYLAQIPFTEEQLAESDALIADGLFNSGVIFKDKLDNLSLSGRMLTRLVSQYADYEKNDESYYHLFLLYSRQQRHEEAARCIDTLKMRYPDSQWTILLSDPNYAENQRFGVHIEDSLYAATYDAFKGDRHDEVHANAALSESRFPLGQHRPKFLFVEGLAQLNEGQADSCVSCMKLVVEKYPESEVSEMAGMILRGVQQGRQLHGGKFDISDIWSRRNTSMLNTDSLQNDTLRFERNVSYVFLLAYQPDSVNQNQLLYELAKYNFTNYLVRNFEIVTDQDANGLCRMLVSGFLSYDEAQQYARQLYRPGSTMLPMLQACRSLIVSEDNLHLLGTVYSYRDYELFFEQKIAPVPISDRPLLESPAVIIQQSEEDEEPEDAEQQEQQEDTGDPLFDDQPQQQNGGYEEFDDDFWR